MGRGAVIREGRDVVIFALGKPASGGAAGGRYARGARHRVRRGQPHLRQTP